MKLAAVMLRRVHRSLALLRVGGTRSARQEYREGSCRHGGGRGWSHRCVASALNISMHARARAYVHVVCARATEIDIHARARREHMTCIFLTLCTRAFLCKDLNVCAMRRPSNLFNRTTLTVECVLRPSLKLTVLTTQRQAIHGQLIPLFTPLQLPCSQQPSLSYLLHPMAEEDNRCSASVNSEMSLAVACAD